MRARRSANEHSIDAQDAARAGAETGKRRPRKGKRQRDPDATAGKAATARRARSELAAFIERFPDPGPLAIALQLAGLLLGNGYLLWRIWRGELPLTGLVLLVLVEGVALSLLAAAQQARIPAGHRLRTGYEHYGLPDKVVTWTAFVFAIGGAYLLWAFLLGETGTLLGFLTSLAPWRESGLDIAIALTLGFAAANVAADRAHYQRRGAPFISSVEIEATTRRVTFAYGAMVIAVPLIAILALSVRGIAEVVGGREDKRWAVAGMAAFLAVFYGSFHALAAAADSGPRGWATVYLLGKVIIEALFALLPVLAARKARAAAAAAA